MKKYSLKLPLFLSNEDDNVSHIIGKKQEYQEEIAFGIIQDVREIQMIRETEIDGTYATLVAFKNTTSVCTPVKLDDLQSEIDAILYIRYL